MQDCIGFVETTAYTPYLLVILPHTPKAALPGEVLAPRSAPPHKPGKFTAAEGLQEPGELLVINNDPAVPLPLLGSSQGFVSPRKVEAGCTVL